MFSWPIGSVFLSFLQAGGWLPEPTNEPPWPQQDHGCRRHHLTVFFTGSHLSCGVQGPWRVPILDLLLAWQQPLHCRHSSTEDKISWDNSCACSSPHSGRLGSLFSWYTLLYRSLISPWEALYPTSWIMGTSTLASGLGVPCQWLWQIACSIYVCPKSAVCRNILWRMNGQWGPSAFHRGCLSRDRSASRQYSASLMDSPSLFASSLVARDLYHLSLYCSSNKV